MPRGSVCLTFDFDALSAWVARGIVSATPLSRGEFAAVAVPRLLTLLERRSVPATWFVPAHTAKTYPDLCHEIVAAGHEVALHGYAHENVAVLDEATERQLLARSVEALHEVTGTAPVGFRAPSWDLSDSSVEIMVGQGLRYDSSLMGHDHALYRCRTADVVDVDGVTWGRETELVEVPVSWTLDDFPYLEFLRSGGGVMPGLKDPVEMFRSWGRDLEWMLRELDQGILTVTCHPEVIGRGHRLLALEEWLDAVGGEDVEFLTAQSAVDRFVGGTEFGRARG
ncbi:MAG TPA: polysaccharide deacetylase [Marmoricola sp.]|nr:polysaccharide deacetylase [Marmoricola sp.]